MSKQTKRYKTLNIDPEDYHKIKVHCAVKGRTMSSWAGEALMSAIDRETSPTVNREALSDRLESLENPRSVPKRNTDEEVVGITKDGTPIVFEPNEGQTGLE